MSGRVQGVGFRPHVWRTVVSLGLTGDVRNISQGVEVRLVCKADGLETFEHALKANLPALARIDALHISPLQRQELAELGPGFAILPSLARNRSTMVLPDAATCNQCLAELFDPDNRRYRYPFISCTHCGPRFSVIRSMPYDRERTSMSAFGLCDACAREYADPEDRRFHAQTNACDACGPKLWLETPSGHRLEAADPFASMSATLQAGQILALKGLGGFHLCCDARDPFAVTRLRERKRRPAKPLAVMFRNLEQLGEYVMASPEEIALLRSAEAPIVLLRPLKQGKRLAEAVAPDSAWLGCMLPYTPVHHLLLADAEGPLIMTSANRTGLPQVIDNQAAREQLADLADLLVMHDRTIVSRIDDSVMRVHDTSGKVQVLRPGRGVAPLSLALPSGFSTGPEVLALGGDLKNTFCLAREGQLIVSHYQGDLQQLAVNEAADDARDHYRQLYQAAPELLACDLHPDYVSTRIATDAKNLRVIRVQHHHAHLAACLGEHGYPLRGDPVLGICLDGTGYGEAGRLWGGEFLYGGYGEVERLARLQPGALPGGENAIREPWRLLVTRLHQAGIDPLSTLDLWPVLADKPLTTICSMIEQNFNSPASSSAGRVFDAVAAALGCYAEGISYEGQAAVALETLAQSCAERVMAYHLPISRHEGLWQLDIRGLWPQIMADLEADRPRPQIALAFHLGLAQGLSTLALRLRRTHPFKTLVLSGGVMQNALLSDQLERLLVDAGIKVLRHQQVPCNDAGLSLGQALVALARQTGGRQDA